jgi:hypothetical protein
MTFIKNWAGRAFGTNTGNLSVSFDGPDDKLTGKLRLLDERFGLVIYAIQAVFDGKGISIEGDAETTQDGIQYGRLTATASLNAKGQMLGTWQTSLGTGGTFELFPHARGESIMPGQAQANTQLYSARHDLGAIAISRTEIVALAEEIQAQFSKQPVMVNVTVQTERIRMLEDFKKVKFPEKRGQLVKLYAQEAEASGMNRTVVVELGQNGNWMTVQSSDEAWVLGFLEKLKQHVVPLQRFYPSQYKKFGVGFNQLMLAAAIAYLPSLPGFPSRVGLMAGVFGVVWVIGVVHKKFIPFTTIYLSDDADSVFRRVWPTVVSTLIAVLGGAAATILAGVLQGWLQVGVKI